MEYLAVVGATVIDGTGGVPLKDATVLIAEGRIVSVSTENPPPGATVVNAAGKFVIPGLMDANVHLVDVIPESVFRNQGRYHESAFEGAAIALRAGVTTVFDTWGPLEPLVRARDAINAGTVTGSRIHLAGNIIGFSGPLSDDFFPPGPLLGTDTVEAINTTFEAGVGADLLWLSAEDLRDRVRAYLDRGLVDFVKYAASGHKKMEHILFSGRAQRVIVEEAHRAGLTVQAHTTSPESLRMEIEAGADLLQHPDATGPHPIPEDTLKDIVDRQIPCAALVQTERYLEWSSVNGHPVLADLHRVKDLNDRRLIDAGAKLLLTTDSYVTQAWFRFNPMLGPTLTGAVDLLTELGEGHFLWLEAVTERGMAPMDALLAATRNIAEAYHVSDDLGTLEPGKRADLVVLDADPLADARNYRRIAEVMKDGVLVNRDELPVSPWREVAESTSDGSSAGVKAAC